MSPFSEHLASLAHVDETADATARYLEALTTLSEPDVRAPSLLPGWSRGHVITHVARNADGLPNQRTSLVGRRDPRTRQMEMTC